MRRAYTTGLVVLTMALLLLACLLFALAQPEPLIHAGPESEVSILLAYLKRRSGWR